MSINTEAIHSNIKQLGFSGGVSFLNRNLFKGAEILKLAVQGAIFNPANNDNDTFDSWELGADLSLEFPRFILLPNSKNFISQRMTPTSLFSVGSSFQKNIGLDRQTLSSVLAFKWINKKVIKHNVELLNIQYIKNLNTDSYFDIYSSEFGRLKQIQENYFSDQTLNTNQALSFINSNATDSFKDAEPKAYQEMINIRRRREILTSNYVSPSIAYSVTYNTQQSYQDRDFTFSSLELALLET